MRPRRPCLPWLRTMSTKAGRRLAARSPASRPSPAVALPAYLGVALGQRQRLTDDQRVIVRIAEAGCAATGSFPARTFVHPAALTELLRIFAGIPEVLVDDDVDDLHNVLGNEEAVEDERLSAALSTASANRAKGGRPATEPPGGKRRRASSRNCAPCRTLRRRATARAYAVYYCASSRARWSAFAPGRPLRRKAASKGMVSPSPARSQAGSSCESSLSDVPV